MGYSFIPSNRESISDKNTRSIYNWVMSKQDSIDIKHRVNNPLAIAFLLAIKCSDLLFYL